MKKELLFSVTGSDCTWKYTRGSGPGGQKKNKTSSAVHCKHRDSGARGYAEDSRSQAANKGLAFKRMCETKEFKAWHQLETMKRLGQIEQIEKRVDRMMLPKNLLVEVVSEDGKWVEEAGHEAE